MAPKDKKKKEKKNNTQPKATGQAPAQQTPQQGTKKESTKKDVPVSRMQKLAHPKRVDKKVSAAESKKVKLENAKKKVAKLLAEGKQGKVKKITTDIDFKRPITKRHPKNPQYLRRAVKKKNALDAYKILKYPVTSDAAMKLMEDQNTLVFITNLKASKKEISTAFNHMYQIKPAKVNTLIRSTGEKKAFIKFPADKEAVTVANKIGIC